MANGFDIEGKPILGREAELSRVVGTLQALVCPIQRETAVDQFADVTLLLADREAYLGELIAASASDEFGRLTT